MAGGTPRVCDVGGNGDEVGGSGDEGVEVVGGSGRVVGGGGGFGGFSLHLAGM